MFMLNLGSGHRRSRASIELLRQVPPRGTVLFAIASGQLATMDGGVELARLKSMLRPHAVGSEDLPEILDEISARIPLVQRFGRVSTPHPVFAGNVVEQMLTHSDVGECNSIYWELFEDAAVALGGLGWLAGKAPYSAAGAPERLVNNLLKRCGDAPSEHVGQAGFLLATLLSRWHVDPERLRPWFETLGKRLSAGEPEHAYGLAALVNELINADQSKSFESGQSPTDHSSKIAEELVGATSADDVAAWASEITLDDSGAARAHLLERLATAGSRDWCSAVAMRLSRPRIAAAIAVAQPDQIAVTSKLILSMELLDHAFCSELIRLATPPIVEAMRTSVPDAFASVSDVFWQPLGFLSFVFDRSAVPDDSQLGMIEAILVGVGADSLAGQLTRSQRRDWQTWRYVAELLRVAAPELVATVAAKIDLEPLVSLADRVIDDSVSEANNLLMALALDPDHQPAKDLVWRVYVPRTKMSDVAALLAPNAAAEVIEQGGTFGLQLSGGLPRWAAAARVLADVHEHSPRAARKLLQANADDLADGLVFRQATGGDGAIAFLQVAASIGEDVLLRAFERIDTTTAETTWRARLENGGETTRVVEEILRVAQRAQGTTRALAEELSGRAEQRRSRTSH